LNPGTRTKFPGTCLGRDPELLVQPLCNQARCLCMPPICRLPNACCRCVVGCYSLIHSLTAYMGWRCIQAQLTAVSVLPFHQSAVHPGMSSARCMHTHTDSRLSGEWTVKLAIISCEYTFDWIISPLHINQLQW